jgi:hypothetical protein
VPRAPETVFLLPVLERWHKWLLGGLFGLFVVELALKNLGVSLVPTLAWWSFGAGFEPWQLVTRFLVQGDDRQAVASVAFSLLLLYFFLPMMESLTDRRTLARAVGAGALGGTLLPLLVDATGWSAPSVALGWRPLAYALPPLLGLLRPNQQILLFFFPVQASWILWGTLVLALLNVLAERSLDSFQELGVWLGVYGWFHLLGPGRRVRDLEARGRKLERELRRFEVHEGGKKGPRGNRPDDLVH